jgi:hypothetical protein
MRPADDSDFTDFVLGSSRRLLGFAYRLTGDARAAEVSLQAALGRTYRDWRRLNREGVPELYVGQLLVDATTSRRKRRRGLTAGELEEQLAASFEALGPSIAPPPDLADRVRRDERARRRRQSWIATVAVVAAGAAGVAIAANGPASRPHHRAKAPRASFTVTAENVDSMAVGPHTLYVAASAYPRGLVTAYDSTTGRQLISASLPAHPNAVAVAADGTVWVTFSPTDAGHSEGVAEFSPDLRHRSTLFTNDRYLSAAVFDVVPLGHSHALLATDRGVVAATLPPLGKGITAKADRANARLTLAASATAGEPTKLTPLSDGNIAVLLSSDQGKSRLVLQHGAADFAGTQMTVAASPEGLWVTTGALHRAILRRLNNALTPVSVGTVSPPQGVDRVWTSGQTVWVATDDHRIKLACFAFSSPTDEPSATFSLPPADSEEATDPVITGDVTIVPTQSAVYVASPYNISSYPVPPSCRFVPSTDLSRS